MTEVRNCLVYIDPGFMETGHYVNLSATISAECRKRGILFLHYTSKHVSDQAIDQYRIIPMFSHKAVEMQKYREAMSASNAKYDRIASTGLRRILKYFTRERHRLPISNKRRSALFDNVGNFLDRMARFLDVRLARSHLIRGTISWLEARKSPSKDQLIASFKEELCQIFEKITDKQVPENRIAFLMYTAHPLHCIAFGEILSRKEYSHLNISIHLFLFYLSQGFLLGNPSTEYLDLLKKTSDLLETNDPTGKITLYMDSQRSIQKYQPYLTRRIIFGRVALCEQSTYKQTTRHSSGPFTIGYFGYVTHKHGFPFLMKAHEYLVEKQSREGITFVVKVGGNFADADLLRAYYSFKKKVSVRHYSNFLDRDAYFRLISECDLIIIPYMIDSYPSQTSGVMIDAITRRKITIVPKNTWMSDMQAEWGAGESFISGEIGSFIAAIEAVLNNFPQYLIKSTNIDVEGFQKAYSASTLLDMLFLGTQTSVSEHTEIKSGKFI